MERPTASKIFAENIVHIAAFMSDIYFVLLGKYWETKTGLITRRFSYASSKQEGDIGAVAKPGGLLAGFVFSRILGLKAIVTACIHPGNHEDHRRRCPTTRAAIVGATSQHRHRRVRPPTGLPGCRNRALDRQRFHHGGPEFRPWHSTRRDWAAGIHMCPIKRALMWHGGKEMCRGHRKWRRITH